MTLAIDITDVWGLSNEVRHKLLPKKSKVIPCKTHVSRSFHSKSHLTSCTLLTRRRYKAGLNKRIKFVCIAMCSLVMGLCSCDLPVTLLITITIH